MQKRIAFFLAILFFSTAYKPYSYEIAVLKYDGGGDWYANPSALKNLARFANENLNTSIDPDYETVEVGSPEIFNYPFIHMTGHGNVVFSNEQAKNLRTYLLAGGFLHIDDNYGMDKYIREELKKVFPDKEFTAISPQHALFSQHYQFPDGLPKIHEHDKKPPEAWGYYHEGKLVLLYTHESDLGDGWEDPAVHNDPPKLRQKALQMGANILQYALNQR